MSDANPRETHDLFVSYARHGDLVTIGGGPAAARRYYADGLTRRENLSEAAPENAQYARDL